MTIIARINVNDIGIDVELKINQIASVTRVDSDSCSIRYDLSPISPRFTYLHVLENSHDFKLRMANLTLKQETVELPL